jgi:CHAT domain-containing protein
MRLCAQTIDIPTDTTLTLEEKEGRYRRLIEDSRPYADAMNRGEIYSSYCEVVGRTKPDVLHHNLNIGIAEAESYGDYTTACQMLGVLGLFHLQRDEFDAMSECYDRALAHARRTKSWQEARVLSFYAGYFRSRGQLALTRDLFLQAQDACRRVRGNRAEIRFLAVWLDFLADLECWDTIDRDLPRAALLIQRGRPYWTARDVAFWQNRIDNVRLARAAAVGSCGSVGGLTRRSLNKIATLPPHALHERIRLRACGTLLRCGDARTARTQLEIGRANCVSGNLGHMLAEYDLELARAHLALGEVSEAQAALCRFRAAPVIRTVDAIRVWRTHDILTVQSNIRAGRLSEARHDIETGFDRLLDVRARLDVSPETSLTLASSRPLLDAAHQILGNTPEDSYALEMFWRRLQVHSTAMSDTLTPRARPLLEQVRESAGELAGSLEAAGALHCVYNVTREHVRRWTTGEGRTVCDTLDVDSDALAKRVESIAGRLADARTAPVTSDLEFARASHELTRILLPAKLLESPRELRLFISADGFLLNLPFEALSLSPDRYEPLVTQHEVAALRFAVARAPAATGSAIAVYGPDYPLAMRWRYPVLAEDLRHAPAEIAHLCRTFPSTMVLRGARATKAELLSEWENAPLLHFATHVVRDPEIKYVSFLPLAVADTARVLDSYLEVADIRRADLRGCDVVVLSGCATGAPYVGAGATGPSLGDAFLDAGAHAVVNTYWSVRDDAATSLMTAFVDGYARSGDPIEALAQARREAWDRGVDPRDWLAYSVMVNTVEPRAVVPELFGDPRIRHY